MQHPITQGRASSHATGTRHQRVQQRVRAGAQGAQAVALSASLWLSPSLQGTKIMPVGATRATFIASCPAPLSMSMLA